VINQSGIISKILKNYNLCEYCAGRLTSKLSGKSSSKFLGRKHLEKYGKRSHNKCYVCKNIFDTLDIMLSQIYDKTSDIDFKTFNIGLILKPSFLERDDFLKSRFKIKGVENIKYAISTELAKKISRKTKSERIVDNPDLFIQVNFKENFCSVKTKPLFVYGRYTKKIRKLPQKQKRNPDGNFLKKVSSDSIEARISDFFTKKFFASQVRINWIGGEDQSSLVIGNGRPFFVKIINPKKRHSLLRKNSNLDSIVLSELRKLSIQPKGSIPFRSEVLVTVDTKVSISLEKLEKLKILQNAIIKNPLNKKNDNKRIYRISYKKIKETTFLLELVLDGGIPIKSIIQNSNISPNISEILGISCKCKEFTFKNILI